MWMLHTQKEENKHICKHRENENVFCWVFWKIHGMWYLCLFFLRVCVSKDSCLWLFVPNLFTTCSSHHLYVVMGKKAIFLGKLSIVQQLEQWAGWPVRFSRVSMYSRLSQNVFPICLYANTPSMGTKQEELETRACLQGQDLTGFTETWWMASVTDHQESRL